MAWFNANKNRAYQTYPETKPSFGGIAYPDYFNRKLIDVGFSASQNSQSYTATTEQVVEFKRFPMIGDHHKHSPTKKDLYKDQSTWDKPVVGPWGPTHDQPEKARDFSPKFGNQMIHGHDKGSPRYTRDHYGKYNNFNSDDEDDDRDNNHDDDDDDITCHDGVCYKKKNNNNEKHNTTITQPTMKHHTLIIITQPPYNIYDPPYNTTYYETPYPNNHNNYSAPSSYNVPLTTPPPPPPTRDTYYETPNNYYNRPLLNNPPPPIKTRIEKGGARDLASESPKNSPVSSAKAKHPQFIVASPKKYDTHQGFKETIDSAEARRRYAGKASASASPRGGARMEEKYTATIDSREAARRYNGVFVPA